jgi:hypothetical protein
MGGWSVLVISTLNENMMSGEAIDHPEYKRLLRIVQERRGDLVLARRNGLPSTDILELRHQAHRAWQDAELYRKKSGCSAVPMP